MTKKDTFFNRIMWDILPGIISATTILLIFLIGKYAPLGQKTIAAMDANIQYLDFYSYYKDLLLGQNSVLYCFGKSLGGSNIAVFAYYLSSPFCLLLAFFKKTELQTYFNIVWMLKCSLASITFFHVLEGAF